MTRAHRHTRGRRAPASLPSAPRSPFLALSANSKISRSESIALSIPFLVRRQEVRRGQAEERLPARRGLAPGWIGCATRQEKLRRERPAKRVMRPRARVSHQDAVLPQREHGVGVGDFARSLSPAGKHLVRRAIRAQDDQFAVQGVRDDRAAVREEAADGDAPERVIARVRPVAVHRLRRDGEGRLDLRHPHILDDPPPRRCPRPGPGYRWSSTCRPRTPRPLPSAQE